ncbi:MAG: hypothetical protein ACYTAO_13375, partial [Planctomycetota bacterium]
MISQKYFVSAVAVLLLQPPLYSADRSFPQTTGTRWYPCLEWSLKDSSFAGNPFDVEAKVEFTH